MRQEFAERVVGRVIPAAHRRPSPAQPRRAALLLLDRLPASSGGVKLQVGLWLECIDGLVEPSEVLKKLGNPCFR